MTAAFWLSLKKPWQCKSQPTDVHNPTTRINEEEKIQTRARKSCGFGCSRSVSNLREMINGSKRHSTEKQPICSPRSVASSNLLNSISHEVFVSDSTCELRIGNLSDQRGCSSSTTFLGILKPGTPRFGDLKMAYSLRNSRKINGRYSDVSSNGNGNGGLGNSSNRRISVDGNLSDYSGAKCKKCFDKFKNLDGVEGQHLSNRVVTELKEGDSSRKIVEIICRASWSKSKETNSVQIQKVLKIHNLQTTITEFEQHRESVKNKAIKLQTRHPRCLADGNELLRFHGATIACSIGINNCSNLCNLKDCGICQILRNGFGKKDMVNGEIGVFTASTGGRALENVVISEDKINYVRKGLVICRVIAGRVHKPLENCQEFAGKSSFDSLAGKIGQNSNIEELYLLNPKALLPCFIVL